MRKSRFEPKEKTKSYIFLPPMLEIDPVFMQVHLLLNCYLYSEDLPDIRNSIFLHYEYQDLDSSFARLENNLKKSPYYRGMYEPDKYTTIFYFHVPNKWFKDYLLFINSKYSHISEGLKHGILRYYNIGQSSQVYKVLYRDSEKRRELEKELDVTLPEDAEIATAINFSKETYTELHKIIKVSEPNPEIWETS
tara:strand:+ start:14827 stop:15405 length:579 start_codon:yes stop_codon:yes gene_type:complete